MKKRIALLTILLTLVTGLVFSNDQPEIFIRLFNQQLYYSGKNVNIQIELKNRGISSVSFKLADSRVHNLKLDVRTLANDPIEECDKCIKEFISSQPIYYTEIKLQPGEQFSFVIRLEDFVKIEKSGKYFIRAWFFNEFRAKLNDPSGSNVINLEIAPPIPKKEETDFLVPTKATQLKPEPLYPDEVIRYILEARKMSSQKTKLKEIENEWNKYFLYFNLEELLLKSGQQRKEYLSLSEKERHNRIEDFRKWIIEGKKDKDLLLIPTKYKIIKTSFTDKTAVVVVYKEFDNTKFVDRKQYSYYLRKVDNIWTIYDYSIINMMESADR